MGRCLQLIFCSFCFTQEPRYSRASSPSRENGIIWCVVDPRHKQATIRKILEITLYYDLYVYFSVVTKFWLIDWRYLLAELELSKQRKQTFMDYVS